MEIRRWKDSSSPQDEWSVCGSGVCRGEYLQQGLIGSRKGECKEEIGERWGSVVEWGSKGIGGIRGALARLKRFGVERSGNLRIAGVMSKGISEKVESLERGGGGRCPHQAD